MSKGIVRLSAFSCSWLLFLLPMAALSGNLAAFAALSLALLASSSVVVAAFKQAQIERRRDPAKRRAYARAHGYKMAPLSR
jgi:hypothetical protein